MNFLEELYKHNVLESIKNYLLKSHKDYLLFFVTYTFQNTTAKSKKLSPMTELIHFRRKLNQAALSRASTRDMSIELHCFREKSHECKTASMRKEDHFHCFFLLPKNCKKRFLEQAVQSVSKEYYDKLDKEVDRLYLDPKIYKKPDKPIELKDIDDIQNPHEYLKNYDIDVRHLPEQEDVARAFKYATKKVLKIQVNYSLAEYQKFRKTDGRKKRIIVDEEDFYIVV